MRKMVLTTLVAVVATVAGADRAAAQIEFEISNLRPVSSAKVAHIHVGVITETPMGMPPLFGEAAQPMQELLGRLKKARLDQGVEAVILDLNDARIGPAQMAEIRREIRKLTSAEKDVLVSMDSVNTMHYALASAAQINIVPTGNVNLVGLYSRKPYIAGLLASLSIEPDFIHTGDYKTAAETLTRTGPSEESQQMTDWLYDSLYKTVVSYIAEGRGLTDDRVRELIDGGPYLAEEALSLGLIDTVQHQQDFIGHVLRNYGPIALNYGSGRNPFGDMPTDPFSMIGEVMKMLRGDPVQAPSGVRIAVIYIDGAIQNGVGRASLFGTQGAYSTTIRQAIDAATKDGTIKAIVLRVNSPGGSALASEVIWNAAKKASDCKPLVVSMGDVAASGGYYVSAPARTIFVEPTTITGSIGVVGGKFVTTGGWSRLHIAWHSTQRGRHAGIYSSAARFSESERAKVLSHMGTIYENFKSRVTDGRGGKLTKPIDELAGGRVYTGTQALELGLADKIGGLADAIRHAASEAGIRKYDTVTLPAPPTILDALMGGGASGLSLSSSVIDKALEEVSRIDPDGANAVKSSLSLVKTLSDEGVVTMMVPGTIE